MRKTRKRDTAKKILNRFQPRWRAFPTLQSRNILQPGPATSEVTSANAVSSEDCQNNTVTPEETENKGVSTSEIVGSQKLRADQIIICASCHELGLKVLLFDSMRNGYFELCGRYMTDAEIDIYYEKQGPRDLAIFRRLSYDFDHDCAICTMLLRCVSGTIEGWLQLRPTRCSKVCGTQKNEHTTENNIEVAGISKLFYDMRGGWEPGRRLTTSMRLEGKQPSFGSSSRHQHLELLSQVNVLKHEPDYALANAWLKTCQEKHEICRIPDVFNKHRLSNIRLLDVNTRRLIPYGDDMHFIALSYVWGNVKQEPVGNDGKVPLNLPLTIEHAMIVVRKLGYKYIWVDSVCIDQGDSEDKTDQINHMDVVYSCATATLILLDSPHADFGIPGVSATETMFRADLSREGQLEAFIGEKEEIRVVSFQDDLYDELERSLWMKRAWTYQEALLSQRRIIFTRQQIMFSCNTVVCYEDGRQTYTSIYDRPLVNPLYHMNLTEEPSRFEAYRKLVTDYVKREMTNQEDGLKAISAILTSWEKKISSERFMFGLPKTSFRYALLWSQVSGSIPAKRRSSILPSWSWCGWQLQDKLTFSIYPPHITTPSGYIPILPPLYVRHNDTVLCGDIMIKEPDSATEPLKSFRRQSSEDRIWASYDRIWTVLGDYPSSVPAANHVRCQVPLSPTALEVRGIVLQVPQHLGSDDLQPWSSISEFLRGFKGSKVEICEATPAHGFQHTYQDLLLVAMKVAELRVQLEPTIWLCCIVLRWESKDSGSARIATRAGLVQFWVEEKDFVKQWYELEPRWESFHLR